MSSTFPSMSRVATLLFALAALACGSPGPAPDYPTPEDPALEDTEFAEVLGLGEDADAAAEDDDWDDPGMGGEDASDASPADDSGAAEKR